MQQNRNKIFKQKTKTRFGYVFISVDQFKMSAWKSVQFADGWKWLLALWDCEGQGRVRCVWITPQRGFSVGLGQCSENLIVSRHPWHLKQTVTTPSPTGIERHLKNALNLRLNLESTLCYGLILFHSWCNQLTIK